MELGAAIDSPRSIFIVGAPRTGSTLLYQLMARCFRLPFIANLTNEHFAATPIVGLALQRGVEVEIPLTSSYGKTKGPWQPSEGSAVMSHWFGGGHPSEIVSARILPGREPHMLATLGAVEALYGKPLLVKNAWNCFRIAYLANALPEARFVWIRRDILAAATSDLEARYTTKGDAHGWNSATPANVEQLKRRPPAEQVIENQFEFSRAVSAALEGLAGKRRLDVWYEELTSNLAVQIGRLGADLGLSASSQIPEGVEGEPRGHHLPPEDTRALARHIELNRQRFAPLRHATTGK